MIFNRVPHPSLGLICKYSWEIQPTKMEKLFCFLWNIKVGPGMRSTQSKYLECFKWSILTYLYNQFYLCCFLSQPCLVKHFNENMESAWSLKIYTNFLTKLKFVFLTFGICLTQILSSSLWQEKCCYLLNRAEFWHKAIIMGQPVGFSLVCFTTYQLIGSFNAKI